MGKNKLSESLEKYFAEGPFSSRLTFSGGSLLRAENHRGVLEYSTERIVLALSRGKISIWGEGLCIEAMSEREIVIRGRIKNAEWEGTDGKD